MCELLLEKIVKCYTCCDLQLPFYKWLNLVCEWVHTWGLYCVPESDTVANLLPYSLLVPSSNPVLSPLSVLQHRLSFGLPLSIWSQLSPLLVMLEDGKSVLVCLYFHLESSRVLSSHLESSWVLFWLYLKMASLFWSACLSIWSPVKSSSGYTWRWQVSLGLPVFPSGVQTSPLLVMLEDGKSLLVCPFLSCCRQVECCPACVGSWGWQVSFGLPLFFLPSAVHWSVLFRLAICLSQNGMSCL